MSAAPVPDHVLAARGLHRVTCTGVADKPCPVILVVPATTPTGLCPTHAPQRHVPEPPPYTPPAHPISGLGIHPDTSALCIRPRCSHPHIALATATPDDINLSYTAHDWVWHNPDGWAVGPAGGGTGDICNPCAGWNGREKKPLTDGPRHDLCLRDKTDFRGGDCPCTHHKAHMRGIKPGQTDDERVRAARERLAANRHAATERAATETPTVADYYQAALIDPEEDTDADT